MPSPRSSAFGDVFNMSHIVIIEPFCAGDTYTGGVRPHRFIIMRKKEKKREWKSENNRRCVPNSLIYKITSVTSMPSPFILVFLCLCSFVSWSKNPQNHKNPALSQQWHKLATASFWKAFVYSINKGASWLKPRWFNILWELPDSEWWCSSCLLTLPDPHLPLWPAPFHWAGCGDDKPVRSFS